MKKKKIQEVKKFARTLLFQGQFRSSVTVGYMKAGNLCRVENYYFIFF